MSITLYIPKGINLDELILKHPPQFKPFDKDYCIYILDLIDSIPAKNKKIRDNMFNGFTPINKSLLRQYVKNYRRYIDYLLQLEIIEENNSYSASRYSGGLKYANHIKNELVAVPISKTTLLKKLNKENTKALNIANSKYPYLVKWFKTGKLEIDIESAIKCLQSLYEYDLKSTDKVKADNKFRYNHANILRIANGDFYCRADQTGNRFHTNLTSLKKEFRNFITYDGQTLGAIDIVNSQPYFLQAIFEPKPFLKLKVEEMIKELNPNFEFNFNQIFGKQIHSIPSDNQSLYFNVNTSTSGSPDFEKFRKEIREGNIYEKFGQALSNIDSVVQVTKEGRDIAKNGMFKVLFSPNKTISYYKDIKKFKEIYPNIYRLISAIKQGKGYHNSLAVSLQRIEAKVILGTVCKAISKANPKIPLFTIHDSIVTTIHNFDLVQLCLDLHLKELFHDPPQLKKKMWAN